MQMEGIMGSIDGEKFLKTVEYYVRAFIDRHVKGVPCAVIENLSATDPELIFKSRDERIAK